MEVLNDLRLGINGLNVGSREWWGLSSTTKVWQPAGPCRGMAGGMCAIKLWMRSVETIFFVRSRRNHPSMRTKADLSHNTHPLDELEYVQSISITTLNVFSMVKSYPLII